MVPYPALPCMQAHLETSSTTEAPDPERPAPPRQAHSEMLGEHRPGSAQTPCFPPGPGLCSRSTAHLLGARPALGTQGAARHPSLSLVDARTDTRSAPQTLPTTCAEDQSFGPPRLLCPSNAHGLRACARGGRATTGQTDIDKSHAGDEIGSPGWWEQEAREHRRSRKGEEGSKSTLGTARGAGRRLQWPQWVGGQRAVRGHLARTSQEAMGGLVSEPLPDLGELQFPHLQPQLRTRLILVSRGGGSLGAHPAPPLASLGRLRVH